MFVDSKWCIYIQQLLKWLISSISDITSFRLIIVILSNFYIDIYTTMHAICHQSQH